jgi:cytochrome c-type protein NapC
MEWMLNGRDHGGARPLKAGDRCFDCHEGEEAEIGELVVSGEKLEPNPIPGKRGSIVMNVQSAHDSDNLYMRFQWDDSEHAPVPFADGGKMDPDNQTKLAVMLTTDDEKVEFAERSGCWQTCHHDARTMPDTPDAGTLGGSPVAQTLDVSDGVTKYLQESRTEIEIKGKEGKPRGGWDKLKDAADIQAALDDGQFMDLLRFNSGGEAEDGYILAERVMAGGQGVSFSGGLSDGVWTVEMTRKLSSDQPGDISLSVGEWYNIGFAIHDDYSDARYHHVSLGFKLGFDDEDAEINAIGQ